MRRKRLCWEVCRITEQSQNNRIFFKPTYCVFQSLCGVNRGHGFVRYFRTRSIWIGVRKKSIHQFACVDNAIEICLFVYWFPNKCCIMIAGSLYLDVQIPLLPKCICKSVCWLEKWVLLQVSHVNYWGYYILHQHIFEQISGWKSKCHYLCCYHTVI